jgi:hypothetical protein
MSIEKEKKPRKAPAKKVVAAGESAEKPKAVVAPKAAATKAKAAPRAKTAAKSAVAAGVPEVAAQNGRRQPTHQQIAELAYHFYIERGWSHGKHEQDWFRAEQELYARADKEIG